MQQERDIILRDIEVTLVDLCSEWQCIEILEGWSGRIMDDLTSMLEAHPSDLGKRFPGGKFGEGIINLFPDYKIDGWRCLQGFVRLHRHRRSDESNLQLRFDSLHHLSQPHIILPADRAGVQGNEIILAGNSDGLLGRYTVRRRI